MASTRWDEDYDEPAMRRLPTGDGVFVVKAQMGAGKTKALRELCAAAPDASVLLLTFSRALAAKLVSDFIGFHDYQGSAGRLAEQRVVVCLDSLHRVPVERRFDLVILDEAVSVLLHFNSPLMKRAADNVARLDALARSCRALFFVDAASDLPFVDRVVRYFADARGCSTRRIRNRYVRPTNRKVDVYRKPRGRQAHDVICAAVRRGERVAVCSSTKTFVVELQDHAALRCPGARVVTHVGASGGVEAEPLRDVDAIWARADLLIYSPAVTAGVSFELPHFDRLFANLVRSKFTPGVEVSLQQLFRVRQLRDGGMTIFFSEFGSDDYQPPDSVDCPRFGGLNPREPGAVDHRTPLGRLVAQGVLDMRRRSDDDYVGVLVRALREDHGLEVSTW